MVAHSNRMIAISNRVPLTGIRTVKIGKAGQVPRQVDFYPPAAGDGRAGPDRAATPTVHKAAAQAEQING